MSFLRGKKVKDVVLSSTVALRFGTRSQFESETRRKSAAIELEKGAGSGLLQLPMKNAIRY
jgi:hypothetical protein